MSIGERRTDELAARFASWPEVAAVAVSGSRAGDAADAGSDIDLYVYTHADIPPSAQAALIAQSGGAMRADFGLPYWGSVNVWVDTATGLAIDCMYRDGRGKPMDTSALMRPGRSHMSSARSLRKIASSMSCVANNTVMR